MHACKRVGTCVHLHAGLCLQAPVLAVGEGLRGRMQALCLQAHQPCTLADACPGVIRERPCARLRLLHAGSH